MYLGVAGHMLAFYGKKMNPRAGLLLNQAISASKAIANIPTWMDPCYVVSEVHSTSEVGEILAGCKRIEKESLRWARWELQQRFSALQGGLYPLSHCSTVPTQVTLQLSQEDDVPRSSPVRCGLAGSSLLWVLPLALP